ncbi:hypothetical protein BO78DRAFT_421328 [Aspergillus sclerotiicarbonarius CBS 121057]|uniref:Zn(2)-C6 fungal-type domain-containing protein n=1 Tax=Aspergillus sclerotiicarbonarius (strain CBS 121057 / IBT 28362) TaxID=1448318 RepID=A0A319E6C7_ASPSB|nr:hypothetical protein BO78DRAFT_421328 [Aspergillus sclerotiicarbonarius CBS 121057]
MGKPSEGCGTCRARKVKCDEARPVCGRCRKAKRTCSGYRDPLSLWFRDESQSVARRVKGFASLDASPPLAEPPVLTVARQKSASEAYPGHRTLQSPIPIVNFALDHTFQATCFFLNTYTWFNASKVVESSLHHRAGPAEALGEKAMMAGIASVGLANLANLRRSPSLRLSARREYATALQLTNTALCDPALVRADTTLTAIVCLSLFEIVACERHESLEAWIEHSQGVATLLELRGSEQLQRESGFWMFQALRNEVLIGCLQKKTRFPPVLVDMPDRIAANLQTHSFPIDGDRLVKVVAKFSELQADIREGIISDSNEIISIAMAIDSELGHYASTLSAEFSYATGTWPGDVVSREKDGDNFSHYQGSYHIYQSTWACNVWNNYRYIRILVNGVILTHLAIAQKSQPGVEYDRFKNQCVQIRGLMRQLATDICCSIPFKFGVAGQDEKNVFDSVITKAGTGFTMLLPLFVAALVDGVSSPIHDWVMRCFNVVGRAMGIDTALTLIDLLENWPWDASA